MHRFFGWWVAGFGTLLFGLIHCVVMGLVALLTKLRWITEEDAKAMYGSTPVKAAEAALAYVLAAMSKDWFRV